MLREANLIDCDQPVSEERDLEERDRPAPRVPTSRVLVTGGCGFLGRRWVERLLARGAGVTVLDDFSTGRPTRLPRHARLTVLEGSVLDPDALAAAAVGATSIVHLAAVVGMRVATREPERTYRVSVEGTRNVLAATADVPIVLVSSSAVYGCEHACAASEGVRIVDSVANEIDGGRAGYATGKLHMERLGEQAFRSGRDVRIVRPFNVVGPGQASAYGAVLPRFVRAALAGERLRVHDDGCQRRAFSELETFLDCAERLSAVASSEFRRACRTDTGPVVNIGSPQPTSVLELARAVLRAVGVASSSDGKSPIEFVPYAQDYPGHVDVRSRVPDTRRLEGLIGPVDWPSIETIVARTVQAAQRLKGVPSSSDRRSSVRSSVTT